MIRLDLAAEVTEVRGRPAWIAHQGDGDVLVQWHDPSGLLVTMAGTGTDEAAVRNFAGALHEVPIADADRLVADLPSANLDG